MLLKKVFNQIVVMYVDIKTRNDVQSYMTIAYYARHYHHSLNLRII
jgi:hypothetical protein